MLFCAYTMTQLGVGQRATVVAGGGPTRLSPNPMRRHALAGRPFKGTGHLTWAEESDYDATVHLHLTDADKVCG
jgi:hypothetical protein